MFLEAAQPFAISLLVGLAVGIERERQKPEHTGAMGVRTYTLIALMGTTAFFAREPVVTAGLLLLLVALVASGYWRTRATEGVGVTSEIAAGLVFALGYLSGREPGIAGVVGILTVTILYARNRLHSFTRDVLRPAEIAAALTLATFTFVLLPFVADQPIDPWGIVNLRKLGQIVAMIAAVEFGGYVVERLAGARIGRLATGFFGGLASSTAVFVGLPKVVKENPARLWVAVGSGLFACAATVTFYVGIVASASPALARAVAPAAGTAIVLSLVLGYLAGRRAGKQEEDAEDEPKKSPLDVKGALKLGGLIFGFLALTALAQRTLGASAVDVVAFLGGLFELHGVSFASASLHAGGNLGAAEAAEALLLALAASFVSKIGILAALDRGRLAVAGGLALLVVLTAAAAAQVAVRGFP